MKRKKCPSDDLTQIVVRIKPEVHQQLVAKAQAEHRKVGPQAAYLLEQVLSDEQAA